MKRMGCVSTRPEIEENSRIFRVINVDTSGRNLRRGRLEVTDSQLIFHQRGGGVVIRWPLTCLRRYGFDSEIFSFECGRRCATGSGVYGFKCRRAEALFTVLQQCINHPPNTDNNPISRVPQTITAAPSIPNGIQPCQPSPTLDESGYLEPITVNSRLHHPTATSRTNNGTVSPGRYVCIHESTQTNDWPSSLPRCCSLVACVNSPCSATHHYVNNELIDQEVVINQYVNHSVVVSAEQFKKHCCSSTRSCSEENSYVNSTIVTLSPNHVGKCVCNNCNTVDDFNTNYAKLDDLLKQEQSTKMQHFYVNVKPEPTQSSSLSGRSTPTELPIPSCPCTIMSVVSPNSAKVIMSPSSLCSPTISDAVKEQQDQVNYAELDLDTTESCHTGGMSAQNSLHSLTSSPVKTPEGYAQIDFDRTVALSNSANPCPLANDDSMRKTRHNAVIPNANASA